MVPNRPFGVFEAAAVFGPNRGKRRGAAPPAPWAKGTLLLLLLPQYNTPEVLNRNDADDAESIVKPWICLMALSFDCMRHCRFAMRQIHGLTIDSASSASFVLSPSGGQRQLPPPRVKPTIVQFSLSSAGLLLLQLYLVFEVLPSR